MESHHIWPTHLGGPEDGPQVNLCGNCHSKIHYCALALLGGRSINKEDANWLHRAAPLIRRIVKAVHDSEDMDLGAAPARIILKIDKAMLRRIHTHKRDLGFRSLQKYIMTLVLNDLPPISR
jgi:hypothetical protein